MGAAAVPIFSAVASTVAGGLVSKLMTDKPKTPKAPEVEPVTAMPDPLAQQAQARRKTALTMSRQMTAANTVLSGGDSKLGA
jgi:hypothetical protein